MGGNSFGKLFNITTWGESHGKGIGVVIDGCPPGITITEDIVQEMMDKRKPGGSKSSTSRRETDTRQIMSGIFEEKTTGTPIMICIENKDSDSSSYEKYKDMFRPGHGDITYQAKYGIRDWKGGGRASARETAARVAAGAIAKEILRTENIEIIAYTLELGGIVANTIDLAQVSKNNYGCPDKNAAKEIEKRVVDTRKKGDSIGGIVEILVTGVPAGLGEPVFDKLDADIAKAMMSIGAIKGIEIGAGFQSARMLGSESNDPITPGGFESNNSGGILAGISNGDDILIRVAVKPIPSIEIEQDTIDVRKAPKKISVKGRHDISAIPRINVVCESMVAIALADHLLRQRTIT
jgi:chorismate synthase